jgi:plasmid stabilization system protein ParE
VSWQLVFEAAAQAEVAEVFASHEQQSYGLGGDFLRMLAAVVEQLTRNPRAFPPARGRFRRILLRRFPYALHFELLDEQTVSVLACVHYRGSPAKP